MTEIEIRKQVLLSVQKALLGHIYPSIRGIAIEYKGFNFLKIVGYLDKQPDDFDYENLSEITSEVCADINFIKGEELCYYSKEPFYKLDNLDEWVYLRKED